MIGVQSRNSVKSNSLLIQSLATASLLHDIGKFHQRNGKAGSHESLGSEFCRRYLPQYVEGGARDQYLGDEQNGMPPASLYIAEDVKEAHMKAHEVLSACQDLIGTTGALND